MLENKMEVISKLLEIVDMLEMEDAKKAMNKDPLAQKPSIEMEIKEVD